MVIGRRKQSLRVDDVMIELAVLGAVETFVIAAGNKRRGSRQRNDRQRAVAGRIADADAPLLTAGFIVDRADVAAGVDGAVNQPRFG